MRIDEKCRTEAVKLANRLNGMTYAEWFRVRRLIDVWVSKKRESVSLQLEFAGIEEDGNDEMND